MTYENNEREVKLTQEEIIEQLSKMPNSEFD